jgi:hypothetical protein
MPGLVLGVHVFLKSSWLKDVDGRDKPGHDGMNHTCCADEAIAAAAG